MPRCRTEGAGDGGCVVLPRAFPPSPASPRLFPAGSWRRGTVPSPSPAHGAACPPPPGGGQPPDPPQSSGRCPKGGSWFWLGTKHGMRTGQPVGPCPWVRASAGTWHAWPTGPRLRCWAETRGAGDPQPAQTLLGAHRARRSDPSQILPQCHAPWSNHAGWGCPMQGGVRGRRCWGGRGGGKRTARGGAKSIVLDPAARTQGGCCSSGAEHGSSYEHTETP